jgi:anti-sigma factor RsiW
VSCSEFQRSLEALLDGERARCAAHAAVCTSCRELVAPMGDALEPVSGDPPASFLPEVLAQTSGPACATDRRWLCALVDGELDATEASLVRAHMAGCGGCRLEAETLRSLASELPRMAEVHPDPTFVRDAVLAAAATRVFAPDVVAETWRRWMARPRFAVEAAYVGVTLSCLIVLTPLPRLTGLLREVSRAQQLVASIRSEAGIFLDHASSLIEAASAPASVQPVDPSSDLEEQP